MSEFPKLKTGAVMQYPAQRSRTYLTRVLCFVDGSEQRYRESGRALHRWVVRLDQLDEAELSGLQEFFSMQQGRFGSFSFVDPWDGAAYSSCSLENDVHAWEVQDEARSRTMLIIRENRS